MKVICFLFDPNTGGPTIRARSVYERMIAEGYTVRVTFPRGEGTAAAYLAAREIPVDTLDIERPVPPRKLWLFAKFAISAPVSLWRLRAYLKRERPDLIHVNGAFDVLPAIAGRTAGIPVVWHLNDTVFGPRLSSVLGGVVKRVANVIIIAATRVGEHYKVMDANPHVIFAPVDTARFSQTSPKRNPDEPVLTLIGNWNWIKGQDRFVAVIEKLLANGQNVRGRILGKFLDGQRNFWQPILETIKSRGLSDKIETPGFTSEIAKELNNSDLFLLTSHSEASPISLLEAMAMGVPAVCFDVGGVTEMMSSGDEAAGIVVPEGDVDAMSNAIQDILNDPGLYARMSENGQKRVSTHFTLEACIARHKLAYADATGTREDLPS